MQEGPPNWGALHQRSQLKPHVHEVIPWGVQFLPCLWNAHFFLSGIGVKLRRLRETPNPHIWNRSEVISRYHYILCTICQTLTAVRNAFFCQQKRKGCPEFIKTSHKTRIFTAIFFQFQDLGSTLRTQYINQIYYVYHVPCKPCSLQVIPQKKIQFHTCHLQISNAIVDLADINWLGST